MDYETLSNCFVGVFEHYKKEDVKVFVIHALQNDLEEFISFLENNVENREWHISYNGLAFDAQITQHILNNKDFLLTQTPEEVAAWIYQMAQDCINRSKSKQWQVYPQWHLTIGQIDIFKISIIGIIPLKDLVLNGFSTAWIGKISLICPLSILLIFPLKRRLIL